MVLMVIVEGSEVEAKRKTSFIEFFSTGTAAAAAAKLLQSCLTLQPHRWQPTRVLSPWDSPGKNTGVKTSSNAHPTFNSHNHPLRKVLPSKFCKDKREAWRNYIFSQRDTASWKDRVPIQGLTIFFSIKGQKINIFGCMGHMVSVAVINLCGFITEAAIGLPWWLSGKEFACQCRRQGFDPWFKKIPQAVEQLSLYTTTIESEL